MNTICISIPKKHINAFLQLLWVNFESQIGKMGCVQSYYTLNDPQVYYYDVHWCSDDTPFAANIIFNNHTNNGIFKIDLEVVDKESKQPDDIGFQKIKDIILQTKELNFTKHVNSKYVATIIKSAYILASNYHLKESDITLLQVNNKNEFQLIFPIEYYSQNQINHLFPEKLIDILSGLSVITTQSFNYDHSTVHLIDTYAPSENNLIENEKYCDNIEYMDFDEIISEDRLYLPKNTDALLYEILMAPKHIQSSRRFRESLIMRGGRIHSSRYNEFELGHLIQYEILAYVAAIESLLDNSKEKSEKSLKCPNCDTEIKIEEYKVLSKYREFISINSKKNEHLIKIFNQVYTDRSKFIHTGRNLHTFAARGYSGPFNINGKETTKEVPDYYFNIPEYVGYILRRYYINITKT